MINFFLHSPKRPLLPLVLVALAALPAVAVAEDVVVLSSAEESGGTVRVSGEIIDYTGQAIRIRTSTGQDRSYAAERVLSIETKRLDEQKAGDTAQRLGNFEQAVQQYRMALSKDMRLWSRRELMAEQIWCYRALDQTEQAGDTFLLLVSSDPTTQYFDSIPLAWLADEDVSPQKADAWLQRSQNPAAVLLAASHLLSTNRRDAALQALRHLTASDDRRLAALAEAQTWRARLGQADSQEIDQWAERIERMPDTLRAGPYFLLGTALNRQKRWQEAAVALMHVPILFERDRRLSAAALLGAGEALERLGRPQQAKRLYQELVQQYAQSRDALEAEQRLERLAGRREADTSGESEP